MQEGGEMIEKKGRGEEGKIREKEKRGGEKREMGVKRR